MEIYVLFESGPCNNLNPGKKKKTQKACRLRPDSVHVKIRFTEEVNISTEPLHVPSSGNL